MSARLAHRVQLAVLERCIRGAVDVKRTRDGIAPRRLPLWTRTHYADQAMERVASQTTGMRLAFETAADAVELRAFITRNMTDDVDSADRLSTFVVTVDGVETDRASLDEGRRIWTTDGEVSRDAPGRPSRIPLALGTSTGAARRVEIWLPHNSWVEIRGLSASAPVREAPPSGRQRWVHHGSSISHGTNAPDPRSTWPSIAANRLGVELVHLGFNGQAHLDWYTAASIRDLAADVITLKLGINLVNSNSMTLRTMIPAVHAFLDVVRTGHPDTPIVLISPIACPIHEDTPGPTIEIDSLCFGSPGTRDLGAGVLTVGLIRSVFTEIVSGRAARDPHLFYLDGRELLGAEDATHLYDNLHPDADGYRLMGTRFADLVRTAGSPLARAFSPG